MTFKSLGDPYNPDITLSHTAGCSCTACAGRPALDHGSTPETGAALSSDAIMERAIESAVVREVFGHNELSRRAFLGLIGGGTAAAILASLFPMEQAKAALLDKLGKPEKTKLSIGFVPITCATPIIMAHPLGFYSKHGLDVDVIKTAGWAVARDKSLAKEYDASHMLTPMPLAMSLGVGSSAKPFVMPAVENINGQAIVLRMDHQDKRDPKQWKGFKFGVPFDYSMHNFLLRYYVAEHGLDPDTTFRFAWCRRRKWWPICAPAIWMAICRPIRSTNGRCGRRSASSTC